MRCMTVILRLPCYSVSERQGGCGDLQMNVLYQQQLWQSLFGSLKWGCSGACGGGQSQKSMVSGGSQG